MIDHKRSLEFIASETGHKLLDVWTTYLYGGQRLEYRAVLKKGSLLTENERDHVWTRALGVVGRYYRAHPYKDPFKTMEP